MHAYCFAMKKIVTVFLLGLYFVILATLGYGKVSTKYWEHKPEAEIKFYAQELEHKLYVP